VVPLYTLSVPLRSLRMADSCSSSARLGRVDPPLLCGSWTSRHARENHLPYRAPAQLVADPRLRAHAILSLYSLVHDTALLYDPGIPGKDRTL